MINSLNIILLFNFDSVHGGNKIFSAATTCSNILIVLNNYNNEN